MAPLLQGDSELADEDTWHPGVLPWRRVRPSANAVAAEATFGRRRAVRTRLLKYFSTLLKVIRRVGALTRGSSTPPTTLRVVPAPTSRAELADLVGRVNWYLGDLDFELAVEGLRGELRVEPGDAPYLDPNLVHPPAGLAKGAAKSGYLLVHRVTPGVVLRMIRARGAVSVVDPRLFHLDDSFGYFKLRNLLTGPKVESQKALEHLFSLGDGQRSTALVTGTGPAARQLLEQKIDHDIRVLCNSAICDRELVEHVRPNVVVFGDHIFHFGPSRYAAAFRADVVRLAEESDCLLVMPEYGAEFFSVKYPHLAERVIAVHVIAGSPDWRWVTPQDTRVRVTGNVLTQFMLPVVLGISGQVDIAGCDGRKLSETYFWTHGRSVQYSDDLMQTVFAAHTPFFRDTSYKDYYTQHCAQLEEMLAWAETQGRVIRSVTASYIPALARRS